MFDLIGGIVFLVGVAVCAFAAYKAALFLKEKLYVIMYGEKIDTERNRYLSSHWDKYKIE